ncbi:MAG: hypothetical protein ACI3XR_05970 [Eubacteriales bacterium]
MKRKPAEPKNAEHRPKTDENRPIHQIKNTDKKENDSSRQTVQMQTNTDTESAGFAKTAGNGKKHGSTLL